jgi:hypothetical protein
MIRVMYSDLVKDLPNISVRNYLETKHGAFNMTWKANSKTFGVQNWHVQDLGTLL